jgi:hypothetical protein
VLKAALVRWYTGAGSEADHRASVTMIVKARAGHRWIACDCLKADEAPPLMSPAYLSEAETYYLRRLTSRLRRRPEHHAECPFYRSQAPQRVPEPGSAAPEVIAPPDGYFLAHKPAPEKLSQAPDQDDSDDRSRGSSIPRLARLLWRLTEVAQVNVLAPLPADRGTSHSMSDEFGRLRHAAEALEIAPGIPLARHLYTHIEPYERKQVFARLREATPSWPDSYAPQAFLLLYAVDISGTRIVLVQGRELELKTQVQHIGVHSRGIGGPYLVLVLVGEHNPRDGFDALRGYAQPIHGSNLFMPVHSAAERSAVTALTALQYRLRRRMVTLSAKKPLFDVQTTIGPVRPDFVVDLADHRTGELAEAAIVVTSFEEPEHIAFKARQTHELAQLGEVIALDATSLADGALERSIAGRFDLKLQL